VEDNFPWRVDHFVDLELRMVDVSQRARGRFSGMDRVYLDVFQQGKYRSKSLKVSPLRLVREVGDLGKSLVFEVLGDEGAGVSYVESEVGFDEALDDL
jgi:hypothetical protein